MLLYWYRIISIWYLFNHLMNRTRNNTISISSTTFVLAFLLFMCTFVVRLLASLSMFVNTILVGLCFCSILLVHSYVQNLYNHFLETSIFCCIVDVLFIFWVRFLFSSGFHSLLIRWIIAVLMLGRVCSFSICFSRVSWSLICSLIMTSFWHLR